MIFDYKNFPECSKIKLILWWLYFCQMFLLTHLSVVVVDAGAIPIASILQSLKSSLQSLSGFFPCLAHPMYPQMHVTKFKNNGIYSNICFPITKILWKFYIHWANKNHSSEISFNLRLRRRSVTTKRGMQQN